MCIESMMPSSHLILLSLSPSAPNPSQHQGLFQWINCSHEVDKVWVSALTSVLPMNTQDWSPLGWTGWIFLQSKGLSRVFSNTWFKSVNSSAVSFLYSPTLTSYMTTGKTIALTRGSFIGKIIFLLFNMLSKLVITFLPRSKCLLISWLHHHLQWFWSPKTKAWHCFHCFPWSDRPRCHDLRFLNVEL